MPAALRHAGRRAPDDLRNLLVVGVVVILMAGFALAYTFLTPPRVPPVKGYLEGQEIEFIHTEVSDPKVAELLTDMTGPPVLVVPSLAQAPEAMLVNVYVFATGIKGGGPLEFQLDVFDHPPDTEGYSPLRALQLATWKDERSARELKSAAQVREDDRAPRCGHQHAPAHVAGGATLAASRTY